MRVCVIVPSEAYLNQAGARIRYERLRPHLAALGVKLELRPVGELRASTALTPDVCLISKVQDARGLLVAAMLSRAGVPVGVDLFDDYVSDPRDSRFPWHREWLRRFAEEGDFALCSTPAMAEIAARYMPAAPVHVMNDPYAALDEAALGAGIAARLEALGRERTLRIGWFGIGDNPHFPVGLHDLAGQAWMLRRLRTHGLRVDLRVLTNRRALTTEGLGLLRRLDQPFTLEEWSEAGEAALLAWCHACLLPVGAQGFSIVKSLNRAVTALTAGAQVLAANYPLYAPLGAFLYRDPDALVRDLLAGTPLVRDDTLPGLRATLDAVADPAREAEGLKLFFKRLLKGRPKPAQGTLEATGGRHGLIAGRGTAGETHKAVQRLGQLSLGTPFGPPGLNYDATLLPAADGGLEMRLSPGAAALLAPGQAARLRPLDVPDGRRTLALPLPEAPPSLTAQLRLLGPDRGAAPVAALGRPVQEAIGRLYAALFPEVSLLFAATDAICPADGAVLPRRAAAMQGAA